MTPDPHAFARESLERVPSFKTLSPFAQEALVETFAGSLTATENVTRILATPLAEIAMDERLPTDVRERARGALSEVLGDDF